jgi:hypothetical protein
LRFGDSSVLFAAFRYHFIIEGDGDALIGDVSRVTNELEYFEMLNDIAVVARSNSQDPSDTFRTSVINTISPAINRLNREGRLDELAKVVAKYPAYGDRMLGSVAWSKANGRRYDPSEQDEAVRRLDDMGVVAGALRDLSVLDRGWVRAEEIGRATDYSLRVLEAGDVHRALWDLRNGAMDATEPR